MFVYAFDRGLMDDENAGLKSYQALWMRIQNEIVGERFNRFTDMVDLDRLDAGLVDRDIGGGDSIRRISAADPDTGGNRISGSALSVWKGWKDNDQ